MGFLDSIKDVFVSDTGSGVRYQCIECGETFDTARERCPECGSTETKEVDSFEMRPDD